MTGAGYSEEDRIVQYRIMMNLFMYRTAAERSQADVADASGLSLTAYKNIENGRSFPKVHSLLAIGKALGLALDDLLAPLPAFEYYRERLGIKGIKGANPQFQPKTNGGKG